MPRKPIDYSKTHFYKIVCKDTSITDCYVGHTTDFTKRQWQHKNSCKNQKMPRRITSMSINSYEIMGSGTTGK